MTTLNRWGLGALIIGCWFCTMSFVDFVAGKMCHGYAYSPSLGGFGLVLVLSGVTFLAVNWE